MVLYVLIPLLFIQTIRLLPWYLEDRHKSCWEYVELEEGGILTESNCVGGGHGGGIDINPSSLLNPLKLLSAIPLLIPDILLSLLSKNKNKLYKSYSTVLYVIKST